MSYHTIKVELRENICFLQFNRPEANNTINDLMVEECHKVLEMCEEAVTVIVLEGNSEFFCLGADFKGMQEMVMEGRRNEQSPLRLYELWLKMATGPYVIVSHVEGKVNAGGMGFVAASDVVIAGQNAKFGLSELLFGLYPACVLPFLIRRAGFQRANYMTLMTQPFSSRQALEWGVVDAVDQESRTLLLRHLTRLKCLPKTGILRYKSYTGRLYGFLPQSKSLAVEGNMEVFSDPQNLERIFRYVEKGKFPWED